MHISHCSIRTFQENADRRRRRRAAKASIDSAQFRDARVFGGLTRQDAADLLGVSLRTIGHWETGRARPTYAAFRLLRVYRHGDLPHPEWEGYRIIRGRLVTPEGHTFTASDMTWQSLLVRRANFQSLSRVLAYARQREASREAVSLGLVSSSTSGSESPENGVSQLKTRGFVESCNGPKVGPQWGHDHISEAQSSVASGSHAGGEGGSRGHGDIPQCLHRSGGDELPSLHPPHPEELGSPATSGQGTGRRRGRAGERAGARRPARPASATVKCSRRPERSVSLRKRTQGKALPSRIHVTGGAL